mgnify:CR=1 FL=1
MTFFHFKYIFLIVVSIMLTTISSCASSRRMDKNKTSEQFADKRNISVASDSVATSTTKIGTSNFKLTDNNKYNDNLDIEYTPTFDKNGNLIPFHYSKEENGKKTNVNITGNAKVKSSSSNEKVNINTKEEYTYKSEYEEVIKINKKLISEIETLKKTNTKEVKVAPDYLKYIILIGTGVLLLSGVILGIFIYFKSQINKYKSILNTISP